VKLFPPFAFVMQRTLQPEILDSLPPDHPDALHNRRDLRLTNAIVGTHRWFVRIMPTLLQPNETTLEIGAGTGELGHKLMRRGLKVDGLDLWPRPIDWPKSRAWHVEDLLSFTRYSDYGAVIGNLIFHQFSEADLAKLGAQLTRGVRVIVASEPARRRISQVLYGSLGPLFGANRVSLHDAHVSIGAGFRGDELPRALQLDPNTWDIRCETTLLGIYRMIAVRRR
jgi:hypothetical protein